MNNCKMIYKIPYEVLNNNWTCFMSEISEVYVYDEIFSLVMHGCY